MSNDIACNLLAQNECATHNNTYEQLKATPDCFDIVWAEEKSVTRKHDERYKTEFHMYLDEKDNRPEELKSLRPNGFMEETLNDDFPVRNRKFILHVRRRRWLDDDGHSVVLNVYQLTADGTRLSEEFASFLNPKNYTGKSEGRNPSERTRSSNLPY